VWPRGLGYCPQRGIQGRQQEGRLCDDCIGQGVRSHGSYIYVHFNIKKLVLCVFIMEKMVAIKLDFL
jgi:hypothetical protein